MYFHFTCRICGGLNALVIYEITVCLNWTPLKKRNKTHIYPELYEKESIVWPFVKQLLQSSLLLWELVIDLPDVHRLQIWVTVAWVGLANMYKQVLVELKRQKCISGNEHRHPVSRHPWHIFSRFFSFWSIITDYYSILWCKFYCITLSFYSVSAFAKPGYSSALLQIALWQSLFNIFTVIVQAFPQVDFSEISRFPMFFLQECMCMTKTADTHHSTNFSREEHPDKGVNHSHKVTVDIQKSNFSACISLNQTDCTGKTSAAS